MLSLFLWMAIFKEKGVSTVISLSKTVAVTIEGDEHLRRGEAQLKWGEGGGAILEDSAGILRVDPISFVYCGDRFSELGG